MPELPAPIAPGPLERANRWLVCGPAGHGWSALADLSAFFFGSLATRGRARLRRRG